MEQVISLILIFFFVILLLFAILLLGHNYICDGQTCGPFIKSQELETDKEKVLFMTNALWDDGIWPFAYISSAILTGLIFALLPVILSVRMFAVAFLLSFIVFYSIIAFFIHHYVRPIKEYIIDYIENEK